MVVIFKLNSNHRRNHISEAVWVVQWTGSYFSRIFYHSFVWSSHQVSMNEQSSRSVSQTTQLINVGSIPFQFSSKFRFGRCWTCNKFMFSLRILICSTGECFAHTHASAWGPKVLRSQQVSVLIFEWATKISNKMRFSAISWTSENLLRTHPPSFQDRLGAQERYADVIQVFRRAVCLKRNSRAGMICWRRGFARRVAKAPETANQLKIYEFKSIRSICAKCVLSCAVQKSIRWPNAIVLRFHRVSVLIFEWATKMSKKMRFSSIS